MQAWETWHEAVAMVVSRGRRSCADAKPVPVTSRPFIATYTTVLQPRQRSPVAVPAAAAAAAEAQPQPEAPAVPDTVITIREEHPDPAAATQADTAPEATSADNLLVESGDNSSVAGAVAVPAVTAVPSPADASSPDEPLSTTTTTQDTSVSTEEVTATCSTGVLTYLSSLLWS